MKTIPSRIQPMGGNVLMLTLLTAGIIGFILASYLAMVGGQNRSVTRSQCWNAVMPVIEAGIEEAMAHLNENGITNIITEGWTRVGDLAVMHRQSGAGRYVVSITTTNPTQPTIECSGFLPTPIAFSSLEPGAFATLNLPGDCLAKTREVCRSVKAIASGGAIFSKAMVAKEAIDLKGNNVASDSFDSSDPNYSTNGQYDPAKNKDNGDVATNAKGSGLFNAGNADLMGKVQTGPGGSLALGPGSSIGGETWVEAGTAGIQPGHFSDDMNMSFPEIKVPFEGGALPQSGTVTTTNCIIGTGSVTTVSLPSPPPASMTTNYGVVNSDTYPDPTPVGGVQSNLVLVNSVTYPSNAIGPVITNTLTIVTNGAPNPMPPGAIVFSNVILVTNITLPSPPPSLILATNTVLATAQYPQVFKKSDPPPPSNWQPPAPGTYVGGVTNRVETLKGGVYYYHDYQAIDSYIYQTLAYALVFPQSYTYNTYIYSYKVPQSYTYQEMMTNISTVTQQYDLVLDDGDYLISSFSGKVYVRGHARLHVTGNISFTGQEGLTIGPAGRLELYMSGSSTKIAGQGVLNLSGKAENFMYYGTTNNTSVAITGNGTFLGCIYAPNADLTLSGGGAGVEDFIGSTVSRTVTMNGHFKFHYDEDLMRSGPKTRYVLTVWNEVKPLATRLTALVGGSP